MKKLVLVALCCLVFVAGCGNAKENNETQLQSPSENVTVANNETKENEAVTNEIAEKPTEAESIVKETESTKETVNPTVKPTTAPTETPTQKPTVKPTQAPTTATKPVETQKPTQSTVPSLNNVQILADYTLPDGIGWYTRRFLVVKNNNSVSIDINAKSVGCKSDGTLISVGSGGISALGPGETSCFYEAHQTGEAIASYKNDFIVEKAYWKSCISQITCTETKTSNGIIVQATNTGTEEVETIRGCALFFKDGKLVDFSDVYFDNGSSAIEARQTVTQQFVCFKEFDSYKFYIQAYKYN